MDQLEMRPVWLQSGSELLTALDALAVEGCARDTYRLQLLARLDEIGHAKDLGARDTIELLSIRYRLNPTDVRRDLRLALALPKYEAVTAALPDPLAPTDPSATTLDPDLNNAEVDPAPDTTDPAFADPDTEAPAPVRLHPGQAQAIVTALEKVPATVPVEDLQVAEHQMIEAARYLTPADLRTLGRKVVDTLDTDGPEPAEDAAYQREALWLRPVDHGMKFGGFLANENAELLKTAIHALAKPHKTIDGELDPRGRDKRQADALVTILDAATTASTGPGIPHLTVTIDYTDLKTATSQAVGELVHGDNLSAAAVRRLACDAAVLPIVLGSNSQPLDVGTEQRFVTRAMRRALNKRDKGCVICKAPPPQCHAHHIIHWIDGGPTSIDNLALFCGCHHTAVHHGHYTVTITNGVVKVSRPTWADPTPSRPTWANPTPSRPTPPTTTPPTPLPAKPTPVAVPPTTATPATSASTCETARPGQPDSGPQRIVLPGPSAPSQRLVSATNTASLAWLTPEATARLNPWGDDHNTSSPGP